MIFLMNIFDIYIDERFIYNDFLCVFQFCMLMISIFAAKLMMNVDSDNKDSANDFESITGGHCVQ